LPWTAASAGVAVAICSTTDPGARIGMSSDPSPAVPAEPVRPSAVICYDSENMLGVTQDMLAASGIFLQRPLVDYQAIQTYFINRMQMPVTGILFDVRPRNPKASSFHGYLQQIGWKLVLLDGATGPGNQLADQAIVKTIDHIRTKPNTHLVLATHDGSQSPGIRSMIEATSHLVCEGRKACLLGFREHLHADWHDIAAMGLELVDPADIPRGWDPDVLRRLNRPRVTTLGDFNPADVV
jgi:hypothetical protein